MVVVILCYFFELFVKSMFFRDGFNDWVILVNKYLYFDMINFFILIGWLVYYLLLGYFRSSVFLDKFYFVLFNFF